MALHYLNPDDEPRECPGHCSECGEVWPCTVERGRDWVNARAIAFHTRSHKTRGCRANGCNGTGRLGREGAEPDVEVALLAGVWKWTRRLDPHDSWHGPYPTEADALADARKAHREGR